MSRIAVISGGGSWGAYTVGRLKKLDKAYDVVVGCSTGSLMAPLVALGEYDRLCEAYSSVGASDIFNVNPFNKRGQPHALKILWRIVRGKMTLGETTALRKTISRFFTQEDYNKIRNEEKDVIIALTNLCSKVTRTEYKSIHDHSYEEFVDLMWASASIPLVGSLLLKDGKMYCDGGTTEAIPLEYVNKRYYGTNIDVFLHRTEFKSEYNDQPTNLFELVSRLIDIQRIEISDEHLDIIDLYRYANNIVLHYLPQTPEHPFTYFDRNTMKKWIEVGRMTGI